MQKLFLLGSFLLTVISYAQIGINTTSPKTSLEIDKSVSTTVADGFLTVRMTGNEPY